MKKTVVYIAGPITGVPDYKEKFAAAEKRWSETGLFAVLNPATLPAGMKPAQYMSICLPMLLSADLVLFLSGWENSGGAKIERALAEYTGKLILNEGEWEA